MFDTLSIFNVVDVEVQLHWGGKSHKHRTRIGNSFLLSHSQKE